MKEHRMTVIGVAAALALAAGMAAAQAPVPPKPGAQPLTREQMRERKIYGYQLMTPEERNAYRGKLHAAKTQQERERVLAENRAAMQARAKERGVTLPPEPKVGRSIGMGPGTGVAPGSGPGGTRGGK